MKKAIIFLVVITAAFLLFAMQDPARPEGIPDQKISYNYSGIFFDYRLIRYPTAADIVPAGDNISIGIVSDIWNIKFGVVPGNGSYEKRYINIRNTKGYSRMTMFAGGNITDYVSFSKGSFVMQPNESSVVEVTLSTQNASFANYTGYIDVLTKTPKMAILEFLT
jgi:hypothetical protein